MAELEWRRHHADKRTIIAGTDFPGCYYAIWLGHLGYALCDSGDADTYQCHGTATGLTAAKSACQTDYDARVKAIAEANGYVRVDELDALKAKVMTLEAQLEVVEDEIDRWKDASGLECGGDPDGVTPEAAQRYWQAHEIDPDKVCISKQAAKVCADYCLAVAEAERAKCHFNTDRSLGFLDTAVETHQELKSALEVTKP
jgi:hypothetical protein